MSEELRIKVTAGLCEIIFRTGVSTGADNDTRPGISFDFVSEVPVRQEGGKYYGGAGVIGRKDAALLRDMLEIFLKDHAAGRIT
jgi:hypothetical protein